MRRVWSGGRWKQWFTYVYLELGIRRPWEAGIFVWITRAAATEHNRCSFPPLNIDNCVFPVHCIEM